MTKGILSALTGVLCLLAFTSAQAFDEDGWIPGTTHMVVDAGLSAGGDKLVTVVYTNGDTKTIYAGDGLFGDFGVQPFHHLAVQQDGALARIVGKGFQHPPRRFDLVL